MFAWVLILLDRLREGFAAFASDDLAVLPLWCAFVREFIGMFMTNK
jgi:hypothetical protein